VEAAPAPPEPEARPAGSGRRAALGLFAVAGLGALVAVFAVIARSGQAWSGARPALQGAFESGPSEGTWEILEPHGSRRREFLPDPREQDRLLCPVPHPVSGEPTLVSYRRQDVAKKVFGEAPLALFLENYRPRSRERDEVGGRRAFRIHFDSARLAGRGPSRRIWVDLQSERLLRLEDRSFDDSLVHGAGWLALSMPTLDGLRGERVERAEDRRCGGRTDGAVEAAGFPVYEPAWLPGGFARVHRAYLDRPLRTGIHVYRDGRVQVEHSPPIRIVHARYSDGLALLDLMIAPPPDMRRFEEVLRSGARRDAAACPDSLADGPERLLAGPDDLEVLRRVDRCRTTLKIENLGGVSVVLVGRNELPPETYEQVIRSLVRAPGSKRAPSGERPIESWRAPAHVPAQPAADDAASDEGK
jgi:hypothetical protein